MPRSHDLPDPQQPPQDHLLKGGESQFLSRTLLGPGIQERHLPGGAYAVVHHCGPASVRETYEACFRDWSPRYGWKPDSRPMIVELGRGGDWSDASLYVAVTR